MDRAVAGVPGPYSEWRDPSGRRFCLLYYTLLVHIDEAECGLSTHACNVLWRNLVPLFLLPLPTSSSPLSLSNLWYSLFFWGGSCSLLYIHMEFLHSVSKYEREYTVLVFLCLSYFIWHNILRFHPFCFKWQELILQCGEIIFHYT